MLSKRTEWIINIVSVVFFIPLVTLIAFWYVYSKFKMPPEYNGNNIILGYIYVFCVLLPVFAAAELDMMIQRRFGWRNPK